MTRRSGGFRGARPTWTTTSTPGVFTLGDVLDLKAAGQWPRGPVAPTSLAGTSGNGQVALTWTAPATTHGTITDYEVQYSADGGVTWTTHVPDPPPAAAFSVVPSGWTGAGFSGDKLNSIGVLEFPFPADAFRTASLTAAVSGTLRITGTANENGDCHFTQIQVNNANVYYEECFPPPINVTTSIAAGQQVVFSASSGYFQSVQLWIE